MYGEKWACSGSEWNHALARLHAVPYFSCHTAIERLEQARGKAVQRGSNLARGRASRSLQSINYYEKKKGLRAVYAIPGSLVCVATACCWIVCLLTGFWSGNAGKTLQLALYTQTPGLSQGVATVRRPHEVAQSLGQKGLPGVESGTFTV